MILSTSAGYEVLVTGTPTTAGPYSFTLQVTDDASVTTTWEFNGSVFLDQTINFESIPNQTTGRSYVMTATATSNLAVTLESLTPTVCNVSDTTVTTIAVGTCTIRATQPGSSLYVPYTTSNSFTVSKGNMPIRFSFFGSQALSTGTANVSATSPSGLPVTLTSLTPAVCTLSGGTLTLVTTGGCIIQGAVAGNSDFDANTVPQSLNIVSFLDTMAVGSEAGTTSIQLPIIGDWTATSNSSFLHIANGSTSGTGNANVVFSYDAFTGTGMRTGTLTLGGLTLTVTQAGTNYSATTGLITLISSGIQEPTLQTSDAEGNLYFSDNNGNKILKFTAATGQITTILSTANITLSHPRNVTRDGAGNLYFVDNSTTAIRMWSPVTQQVTVVADDGSYCQGIASDMAGNIYCTKTTGVTVVSATTHQITMLVPDNVITRAGALDLIGNFYYLKGVTVQRYNIVTGQVGTIVTGLKNPIWLAVDRSGNVLISDTSAGVTKSWSPVTQKVTTVISGLSFPIGNAVDGNGNIYTPASFQPTKLFVKVRAWIPTDARTVSAAAGSDSLAPVLPLTTNLGTAALAPTSDQSWLTITGVANGVVSYSFTANTTGGARTAHITVLGQQVTVTQSP